MKQEIQGAEKDFERVTKDEDSLRVSQQDTNLGTSPLEVLRVYYSEYSWFVSLGANFHWIYHQQKYIQFLEAFKSSQL